MPWLNAHVIFGELERIAGPDVPCSWPRRIAFEQHVEGGLAVALRDPDPPVQSVSTPLNIVW